MILVFAGQNTPQINDGSQAYNKFKHFGSLHACEQKIMSALYTGASKIFSRWRMLARRDFFHGLSPSSGSPTLCRPYRAQASFIL